MPGSILFIIPAHLASGTAWFRPNGVLQRLGRTSQRVQLPGLPQVFLSLGPSLHSLQVGWGAPWPAPRPLRTVADSSPMCLADSLTNPFPWIIPRWGPQRIQPERENLEKAPQRPSVSGARLSPGLRVLRALVVLAGSGAGPDLERCGQLGPAPGEAGPATATLTSRAPFALLKLQPRGFASCLPNGYERGLS